MADEVWVKFMGMSEGQLLWHRMQCSSCMLGCQPHAVEYFGVTDECGLGRAGLRNAHVAIGQGKRVQVGWSGRGCWVMHRRAIRWRAVCSDAMSLMYTSPLPDSESLPGANMSGRVPMPIAAPYI